MPLVSSPVLLDHAIGAVFEDFGGHSVESIRKVLVILNNDDDGYLSAAGVMERILPGTRLKQQHAELTLFDLWVQLDLGVKYEQEQLQSQFAALLAKSTPPATRTRSFFP